MFKTSLLALLITTTHALLATNQRAASAALPRQASRCKSATHTGHTSNNLHPRAIQSTALYLVEPVPSDPMLSGATLPAAPVLVIVAVGLFAAAQSFINQQLDGDQGLGAFLRDGSGYKKSGFRPVGSDNERALGKEDPLPWLKLPQLDFVDVAGQQSKTDEELLAEEANQAIDELESLRIQLNRYLERGNVNEAKAIQRQMVEIMDKNGIEYQTDSLP